RSAAHEVIPIAAADDVVAIAAANRVVAVAGLGGQTVAVELIIPFAPVDQVVTGPSQQRVSGVSPLQGIAAAAPVGVDRYVAALGRHQAIVVRAAQELDPGDFAKMPLAVA